MPGSMQQWQGNMPCDVTFVCALCNWSWQAQVTFISIVPSAVPQGTLFTWQLSGLHLEAPATEARTMAGSPALGNGNVLSAPPCEDPWHRVTDQIGTGWGRVAFFLSLFTSLPVHPQESSPIANEIWSFQHAIKLQTRRKWLFHFHPGNMANSKPEPQAGVVRSELTSPQQAKNLPFQEAWDPHSLKGEGSTCIFPLTGLQQACSPHFHAEAFQVGGMLSSSTSSSPDCSSSSATCLLSSALFHYYNNYCHCCCCYFCLYVKRGSDFTDNLHEYVYMNKILVASRPKFLCHRTDHWWLMIWLLSIQGKPLKFLWDY